MWKIQYKPNNNDQLWSIFGCYDKKAQALSHAAWVSGDYFIVEVIDQEGGVVWSNYK